MSLAAALLLTLLFTAQVADDPEVAVRAAVQQYYDAQAARDPDKAVAFWSTSAMPRPTRDAFLAVFGEPAEDSFQVEIRTVEIKGTEARVRVVASRTRLIMRGGMPITQRSTFLNAQLWRKETAGWRLLRDGPFADLIADDLIAAAPADRPALYERHRADLVQARLAVSQRATMAITVGHDYPRGKTLFELALEVARVAGDRPGEANSFHNLGQIAYFLRNFEAASDNYDKELAIGRALDKPDIVAAASFGLATVAYTRAEYTNALGFYRDALAVYEKMDDGAAVARALVSIGNVQYLQAEYDAAAESYRRGLTLALSAMDPTGATFARSGLGRVFTAQGDLAAALDMYGQVLADARVALRRDARLRSGVAAALESIGEIYYRLGNTDRARVSFTEARTFADTDPASLGRLSSSLGLTELVAGRFDAALAAYVESRTRFEQAQDPDGVARAWVGAGFSYAANDKFVDAIGAYRTAIKIFDEQKHDEDGARAWLGLSMAQSDSGDEMAALVSARRVGITADKTGNVELKWRAAVRVGDALRKLRRFDEARTEFDRGIQIIDGLAAGAPVDPDARGKLDDSASAWSGLALTLAGAGDARGALDAIEARRAHLRRVQLAAFQRDVTPGMTADEQNEEQAIVRELISTRAQLRAERDARRKDPARLERLEQQFASLTTRRAEQQTKLYARLPLLQQWRGLNRPPLDLAALVPAQTAVVQYLVDSTELLIVAIARADGDPEVTATIVPFRRRDVADQIVQAMTPAVLADAAVWRTKAQPLAAAVLGPVESRLAAAERCVILPDDLLWKVPFEALPSSDRTLGARMTVTYATSLAALGLEQQIAAAMPAHDTVSAAIFAAPDVPAAVRTQLSLAQTGWKEPDAATSTQASADLARAYGDAAVVRTGADGSEAAARASFTAADVVQMAGPFQVSGVTPLFSMMVLSGAGDAADNDGRLEVREWFRLASRARVIVVTDGASFGAAGTGAAMDAIAWAAAAMGVPTLAIARWPADGFAAAGELAAFHAALAKGTPPADAWRAAVAAIRTANAGAPPAAWAGIRLIGAVK